MAFQTAGAAILLVFYGCYFGKMVLQRRAGIRTDQLGRGKSGPGKRLERTVQAAAYGAVLAEAVSIALDTGPFPPAVRALGAAAACAGTAVFILSVATMGDSWRAGVPKGEETALVTRGIYRLSRNPAFLGFDLLYAGMAVMFFNWVLLGVSLFAVFMFHCQIVHMEEPFLAEAFGEAYREYRGEVRRYFGRGRREPRERR